MPFNADSLRSKIILNLHNAYRQEENGLGPLKLNLVSYINCITRLRIQFGICTTLSQNKQTKTKIQKLIHKQPKMAEIDRNWNSLNLT